MAVETREFVTTGCLAFFTLFIFFTLADDYDLLVVSSFYVNCRFH